MPLGDPVGLATKPCSCLTILRTLLEIALSIAVMKGLYVVLSYQSHQGSILFLKKTSSHLIVSGMYLIFSVLWLVFIFFRRSRLSVGLRNLIYLLVALETVPYLYQFGINWPFQWPADYPIFLYNDSETFSEPKHFCINGYTFFKREFENCGVMNRLGMYDYEHSPLLQPGEIRAAFIGNSSVQSLAIPIKEKASKIAERLINNAVSRNKKKNIKILEYTRVGHPTSTVYAQALPFLDKYHINAVFLKSFGADYEPLAAEGGPLNPPEKPFSLVQNPYLQRLMHAPGSNLIALLGWEFATLYDLWHAKQTDESPLPSHEHLVLDNKDCMSLQNPERATIAKLESEIGKYYDLIHSLNSKNRVITFIHVPELLFLTSGSEIFYMRCADQIMKTAFAKEFRGNRQYRYVNISSKMIRENLLPLDLYYTSDSHPNITAHRLIGEAIADEGNAIFGNK